MGNFVFILFSVQKKEGMEWKRITRNCLKEIFIQILLSSEWEAPYEFCYVRISFKYVN
jgi:hypothetical protein